MTDDNQTLTNHTTQSIEISLHPEGDADIGENVLPAEEACTHIPADVHALLAEAREEEQRERPRHEAEERKHRQQNDTREIPRALFALD